MKKLMKKKMNIFGKSFSVFAIAMIAVIGLGAAALVPYISNVVSGDLTVTSPVTIKVQTGNSNLGLAWTESNQVPTNGWVQGDFPDMTGVGGMKENVWFKVENNAEEIVDNKYLTFIISNDEGLTKDEVKAIVSGIEIYDWDHSDMSATSKRFSSLEIENEFIAINSEGNNSYRVSAPIWLWENSDDEKDTVYFNVLFDFPLNAHGEYEIASAVLMEANGEFPEYPVSN